MDVFRKKKEKMEKNVEQVVTGKASFSGKMKQLA